MSRGVWDILGIAPTNDAAEVKRAYARRLKQVHPEDDPAGFQALREAYDRAAQMARNGWAVPRPVMAVEDDQDDGEGEAWPEPPERPWTAPAGASDAGWAEAPDGRWRRPEPAPPAGEWDARADDRWTRAETEVQAAPDLPEDIRAELARERELAAAHKALCDQLTALVSNPDGDRHEALSAMLRIFRSPGMDSLDAYARTERWLAYVVTVGGPVVDEMVEPLIHFFNWNERPVGVDMSHAVPVLQRRDAGIAVRRLERKLDPDHQAWLALRDRLNARTRLRARLVPGFTARVLALLDRIERDLPEAERRINPDAVAWWRARQARPSLPPAFLWTLIIAPFVVGLMGNSADAFGPPSWATFAALWTVTTTALLGLGTAWLHGYVRPRLRWRNEDLAWRAPAWVRLGWAPLAAAFLLLSSVLPVTVPWVAAYWLVLGPLALWTKVVNAHFEETSPRLNRGLLAALPLLAWLAVHAHGSQFVSLCWAAAGVTVMAHNGRPALETAWLDLTDARRRLVATGLAVAAVGAALAVVLAPAWPLRAIAAAALSLLVLGARPIRFVQAPAAGTLWMRWMAFGWIPCILGAVALQPDQVMALTTFQAFGVWLAGSALLTFVWEAAPRLEGLFGRRRRKPGALA